MNKTLIDEQVFQMNTPPILIHLAIINLSLNGVLIEIASTIYGSKRPSDCSKRHIFLARKCQSFSLLFFFLPFFHLPTFVNRGRGKINTHFCYERFCDINIFCSVGFCMTIKNDTKVGWIQVIFNDTVEERYTEFPFTKIQKLKKLSIFKANRLIF